MKPITPCLWFDEAAEEAARFYVSIFPSSSIGTITRYGDAGPRPKGMVLTVAFQLNGQDYMAVNGGPNFTFSPAISLVVKCDTQAELDRYWDALSADPGAEQCGWLKDRYGMSWQIVPSSMDEVMSDRDAAKVDRVMAAVLKMKKLDLAALQRAYTG